MIGRPHGKLALPPGRGGSVIGALALGALLGAGCIFPSFDELSGAADGGTSAGEEDSTTDPRTRKDGGNGTSSGATSSSGTSGTPVLPDGGGPPDTGPPLPREVVCKGTNSCPADRQFCCVGIAPPVCVDRDSSETCVLATFFFCDGEEDGPSGQVCCAPTGSDDIVCSATCNGTVLCNGSHKCPSPLRCNGVIGDGYMACVP